MGLDSFPHDNPLFTGMIGTYGNRYANLALANSDLLLILGSRIDTRQTGTKPETFAREAKIIHIDIDSHELNNKIKADVAVRSDLKFFLSALNDSISKLDRNKIKKWRQKINTYKKNYPSYKESVGDAIDPNYLMHKISKFVPEDAIICVDVGQNQMWAAQSLEIKKSQRFLTQGGMASMGSALPMAIGASFAKPDKTVVVITGDGGLQLNIQELETVFHHNLPIKIILLNNRCYGMVRQFQEQYFGSRFQSTVIGYSSPNFQKVVSAYKIPAAKINRNKELIKELKKLFADKKPRFLEVSINKLVKVIPKLSMGRPVEDQDPLLPRDEFKSNMVIKPLGEQII
jgi:acetolactate synthase-1/2/3 large subunit